MALVFVCVAEIVCATSTAVTTTLGVCCFLFAGNNKNRLYVRLIYDIKECTESITKRIAVGSQPMMNALELPVLLGGGTYGKYEYGGVALDCAGDHRNSGHGNQYYRYSDQYHPEL